MDFNINDTLEKAKINRQKCNEFVENLRDYLLVETFNRIFDKAMEDNIFKDNDSNLKELSRSLLVNYVNEETSLNILRKMNNGGILLTELAKNIERTVKDVKETIDPSDETTLAVDKSVMDNFYQTLDMTDFSDVVNLIQTRVAHAAEQFTDRNYNDKIDLQDAAEKVKDNIVNLKKGIRQSDEDLEQMKEDANIYYKKVNNRILNRSKTLYEQMVYTLAESVMRKEELKKEFISNNRLDMEKIEETVRCMYTFLEMMNTMKVHNITESYIEKVLNELSE